MPPNVNYDASTNNPFPNFHTILLTIPFIDSSTGYAIQIGVSIAKQYNGNLNTTIKRANTLDGNEALGTTCYGKPFFNLSG